MAVSALAITLIAWLDRDVDHAYLDIVHHEDMPYGGVDPP